MERLLVLICCRVPSIVLPRVTLASVLGPPAISDERLDTLPRTKMKGRRGGSSRNFESKSILSRLFSRCTVKEPTYEEVMTHGTASACSLRLAFMGEEFSRDLTPRSRNVCQNAVFPSMPERRSARHLYNRLLYFEVFSRKLSLTLILGVKIRDLGNNYIFFNSIPIHRFGEVDKGVHSSTELLRAAFVCCGRWLLFSTKECGDLASGRHQR